MFVLLRKKKNFWFCFYELIAARWRCARSAQRQLC